MLASCPPRSCVFSCALPFLCFERKLKFWRIWETPLVMPLFCISPHVLGSLEGLFPLLTTQRVKDLERGPLKPNNMTEKSLIWVFFSTLSFILAEIQLKKSIPGLCLLLLPQFVHPEIEQREPTGWDCTWGGWRLPPDVATAPLPGNTTFLQKLL